MIFSFVLPSFFFRLRPWPQGSRPGPETSTSRSVICGRKKGIFWFVYFLAFFSPSKKQQGKPHTHTRAVVSKVKKMLLSCRFYGRHVLIEGLRCLLVAFLVFSRVCFLREAERKVINFLAWNLWESACCVLGTSEKEFEKPMICVF